MITEIALNVDANNNDYMSFVTSPLNNSKKDFENIVADVQKKTSQETNVKQDEQPKALLFAKKESQNNSSELTIEPTDSEDNQEIEVPATLVDIKQDVKKLINNTENIFLEVLNTAVGEANAEKALDLTLDRDVNDIIDSIKSGVELPKEITDIFSFNKPEQLLQGTTIVKDAEETTSDKATIELDGEMLEELNIESIEAEVDDFAENGEMARDGNIEEHAFKAMMNQDSNFEIKLDKPLEAQNAPKMTVVSQSKIIEQVTKQLETLNNNSRVSIVLNPESLGKVDVQIVKTASGMSAQFTVATQEARDILMKGVNGLRESLLSHGVGVENVSVKLSDAQETKYNQDWTEQEGSRGGNKEQQKQKQEKDKKSFEEMMAQTDLENNGNV